MPVLTARGQSDERRIAFIQRNEVAGSDFQNPVIYTFRTMPPLLADIVLYLAGHTVGHKRFGAEVYKDAVHTQLVIARRGRGIISY